MLAALEAGWKFIVGALVAGFIFWLWHEHVVDRLEKEKTAAIEQQKRLDQEACDKANKPAQEADKNALQTCINNLNTCTNKLRDKPATCVPIYHPASKPEAAKAPASGITSTAIDAHNIWCNNVVDLYNNNLDWAAACLKAGNCK